MMNGIIFFKTRKLAEVTAFYTRTLGMSIWLDQADCMILKRGNLLLGFCQRDSVDARGMITIFTENREEVDQIYSLFQEKADNEPVFNKTYGIYHFFARDPENRAVEIQWFDHSLNPYRSGSDLLISRRSVRSFTSEPVSDEILHRILDSTRYAPSARNSQPVYFVAVRSEDIIHKLANVRSAAAPIANAPMALAIVADPGISRRAVQDGDIAAYHLLLAAWDYGVGTCWIADMDRPEVKKILNIPDHHYISTVTPLGWPAESPPIRERRLVSLKNL
ncbi:MAG: nitroreductase family protein [Fidelibacterota bacterium]